MAPSLDTCAILLLPLWQWASPRQFLHYSSIKYLCELLSKSVGVSALCKRQQLEMTAMESLTALPGALQQGWDGQGEAQIPQLPEPDLLVNLCPHLKCQEATGGQR